MSILALLATIATGPAAAQTTASSAAAAAQGAGAPSFAAIAQRAIQNNPDLLARRAAVDAQSRGASAANAGLGPRVDFSASAGYERSNRLDAAGAIVSQTGPGNRATLSLRQPLYDGSEVSSETERLGRLGNVRYFEFRQAEDALLLELGRAWVDIARQRTLIEIAQANLDAHERVLALVQSRVSSGVGRGVDLDQAQGRLSSARLALASDWGALGEATARFQRLAMIAPPANIQWMSLDPAQTPASENEALQQALASSPAIRAAAENNRSLEAELRVRRAAFLPRVAIEGRHDLTARTSTLRDAATSSVQLTFNYNLYAGGGDSLREQDATFRVISTKQQFQDSVLGLRQNVAATWAEQQRQAAMNANAVAYAGSVARTRDVYRIQYDIGQRSLLDLLNTENELAQAQRQQTNSRAEALQAQLRLLSLSGRMHSAFAVARVDAQPVLPPIADPVDMRSLMVADSQPAPPIRTPSAAASNVMAPSAASSPSVATPPPANTASSVAAALPVAVPPTVATPPTVAPAPTVATAPSVAAASRAATGVTGSDNARKSVASTAATTAALATPREAPDRSATLATRVVPSTQRFAPGVELRLPQELNRSFAVWLDAVETGRDDLMSQLYLSQQLFTPIWSTIACLRLDQRAADCGWCKPSKSTRIGSSAVVSFNCPYWPN